MCMNEIIALTKQWVDARALSPNTQRFYELELSRFGAWIHIHNYSLSTLSGLDIRAYLTVLQHEPEDQQSPFHVRRKKALSPRSLEQTYRVLHAFFEWGVRKGHLARNPLWERAADGRDDIERTVPQGYAENPDLSKEITHLLRAEGMDLSGEETLRVATIAHLAFWAGASREEIAKLKVEDFVYGNMTASILLPMPDGEPANIPIPKNSASIIRSYLQSRGGDDVALLAKDPLVASLNTGEFISGWSVRHTLRRWQHKTLPEDRIHQVVGPRQLRKAFQGLALGKAIQERIIARHHRIKKLQMPVEPLKNAHTKRLHTAVSKALSASENVQ